MGCNCSYVVIWCQHYSNQKIINILSISQMVLRKFVNWNIRGKLKKHWLSVETGIYKRKKKWWICIETRERRETECNIIYVVCSEFLKWWKFMAAEYIPCKYKARYKIMESNLQSISALFFQRVQLLGLQKWKLQRERKYRPWQHVRRNNDVMQIRMRWYYTSRIGKSNR